MANFNRVLFALVSVVLFIAALGSAGVMLMVLAWPDTTRLRGEPKKWTSALPFMIVAVVLFAGGVGSLWLGFRRPPHVTDGNEVK